jgi:hypothetical protein
VLLALSIFGVGDLLSPFEREGCRLADPGCSGADQMANAGGKLDSTISTAGIFLFLASVFALAAAMRRADGWRTWAGPARWVGIVFAVLLVATAAGGSIGAGGLFERLLAGVGAAAIAALALRIAGTHVPSRS